MKEELLKSVAAPMQVFFAPFQIAILNIMICVLSMCVMLLFGFGGYIWIPIILVVVVHIALIIVGKYEPHIDNILTARTMAPAKTKNIIKEAGSKYGA